MTLKCKIKEVQEALVAPHEARIDQPEENMSNHSSSESEESDGTK